MGYWTFPRSPATAFWVALWLVGFACGMLLVASDHEKSSKMTDPTEKQALLALKTGLEDPDGNLNSWVETSDPCGDWLHVECVEEDTPQNMDQSVRHVTSLVLFNLNLGGKLYESIGNLPAMVTLDVMRNHLNGILPAAIGRLEHLKILLLSGNGFSGALPPELGDLGALERLQVDENQFSGQIPSTFSNLTSISQLHMNNNSFTGTIPALLGQLPNLLYVLLDANILSGTLPDDLANAPRLRIIQLDNNQFSSIPTAYTRIPTLLKLSMRNCLLSGTLPNFSGSTSLQVLDLSHNNLTGNLSSLALPVNITSVDLSYTNLQGPVPRSVGNLQNLGFLELRNSNLSGKITKFLGLGLSFNESGRVIMDFQDNSLVLQDGSPLITSYRSSDTSKQVWLSGNSGACPPGSEASNQICVPKTVDSYLNDVSNFGGTLDCSPYACSAPEQLRPPSTSPRPDNCVSCAIPIIIGYRLKSPPFAIFDVYENSFRNSIAGDLKVSVDQIKVNSTVYQVGPRIILGLFIFPPRPEMEFNKSEVERISDDFYNYRALDEHAEFGPFEILSILSPASSSSWSGSGSSGISAGAIVGIVCGAILVLAILSALLVYRCMTRRGSGKVVGRTRRSISVNVPDVRSFTFAEMAKATSNFRDANILGKGGYGIVYSGVLEDGQKVAVKRAEEGSLQGEKEFETEIQMLSRVHHRNLVSLVGYCNDDGEHINGEQMLVYEFVPNGNLREHLLADRKPAMDITTRIRIAIGAARGIQYLHSQADPPIFHRDIKSPNILLDKKYNAKVSDFGLSKLAMGDADIEGEHRGHVTTVVKGTPGYLDPEYFLSHKLTDKSDVYSFGVVLLELISGRPPIMRGKNLTRGVTAAYREGDIMSIIDPKMGSYTMDTIEPLLKLAMNCIDSETSRRPSMTDVLHELEKIWKGAQGSDAASQSHTEDNSREVREGLGDTSGQQRILHSHNSSPSNPSRPGLYDSGSVHTESDLISQTNMNILPR